MEREVEDVCCFCARLSVGRPSPRISSISERRFCQLGSPVVPYRSSIAKVRSSSLRSHFFFLAPPIKLPIPVFPGTTR